MTKERHDPCLLDTFVAAIRFMGSEPARPWWAYIAERKAREKSSTDGVSRLTPAVRPTIRPGGG